MLGHLGAGASYQLLKEWLQDMGGEPLAVPSGLITVGCDNEQRLLKNWLARGGNRSQVEVLTNILCAVHSSPSVGQTDHSLHRASWKYPSTERLQKVFHSVADEMSNDVFRDNLCKFVQIRINALKNSEVDDVAYLLEEQRHTREYLVCPACGTNMERRLRNCPNP